MNHFCTSSLIRKRAGLRFPASALPEHRAAVLHIYTFLIAQMRSPSISFFVFPFLHSLVFTECLGTGLVVSEKSWADFVLSPQKPKEGKGLAAPLSGATPGVLSLYWEIHEVANPSHLSSHMILDITILLRAGPTAGEGAATSAIGDMLAAVQLHGAAVQTALQEEQITRELGVYKDRGKPTEIHISVRL